MEPDRLRAAVAAAIADFDLLQHPFYRRWSRGEVGVDELRAYAAEYRHFEAMVPGHLAGIAASRASDGLREQARVNLADEAGGPVTHLILFDRFAAALDAAPAAAGATPGATAGATPGATSGAAAGATPGATAGATLGATAGATPTRGPSPAMAGLLATYRDAAAEGPIAAFSALLAYEVQSAGVAATKARGLRLHGIVGDDEALEFWDVHARVDGDHATWAIEALAGAVDDPAAVAGAASTAAAAWCAFLDEREAARPSG